MSDADIVEEALRFHWAKVDTALVALARMEEQEKSLLGQALMIAHERDRLQGALRNLRRETAGLPEENDRLKDQLAEEHGRAIDVEAALANADANGLRLAEENSELRDHRDGLGDKLRELRQASQRYIFDEDGKPWCSREHVEDLEVEVKRLAEENERYRAVHDGRFEDIVRTLTKTEAEVKRLQAHHATHHAPSLADVAG